MLQILCVKSFRHVIHSSIFIFGGGYRGEKSNFKFKFFVVFRQFFVHLTRTKEMSKQKSAKTINLPEELEW